MILKYIFKFLFWVVGAIFIFTVLANLVIYFVAKKHIYKEVKDIPAGETVLILGASVSSDGELSPIFEDRVNKAIELYQDKKVSKILVSGDNGTVAHNEVDPVRKYLLEYGIPDADIFLDHAGFDTYSTMYRARDIFKVSSVIISTQSFHLYRSVFIARRLGLTATGIETDKSAHVLPKNYIREIFANVKAVLDLFLKREPKYLGEAVPIDGVQNNN